MISRQNGSPWTASLKMINVQNCIRIIKQHIPFGYPAIHKCFRSSRARTSAVAWRCGRNIRIRIGKGRQVFRFRCLSPGTSSSRLIPSASTRASKITRHFPVIHKRQMAQSSVFTFSFSFPPCSLQVHHLQTRRHHVKSYNSNCILPVAGKHFFKFALIISSRNMG